MSDLTSKLKIPLPLGNETVSRAARRTELQAIEDNAARDAFRLKSAIYNSANNRIVCILGPGRGRLNAGLVTKTADSSYEITAPSVNTTYYLYLKSDGTFFHNITGAYIAGHILLHQVATGTTLSTIITADMRGEIAEVSGYMPADKASTDAHAIATAPHSGHETSAGAQAKVDAHAAAAAPHFGHETPAGAQSKVDAHNALSGINAHGGTMANAIATSSTTDPNTTQFSYILTNHANSPGLGDYWHVRTFFYNSKTGNRAQVANKYSGTNDEMYIRSCYNNVWTSWKRVWHSDNDGAGSGLDADTVQGYVPVNKAGDRMTGPLEFGDANAQVRRSGDKISLRSSNDRAILEGKYATDLAQNAYHDGSYWMRFDTAQPAVIIDLAGGGAFIYTAPAGANPIVWSGPFPIITAAGGTMTGPLQVGVTDGQDMLILARYGSANKYGYISPSAPSDQGFAVDVKTPAGLLMRGLTIESDGTLRAGATNIVYHTGNLPKAEQHLFINASVVNSAASFSVLESQFEWEPTRFINISAIYFEASMMHQVIAGHTLYADLMNVTDNAVIVTLSLATSGSSTPVRLTSANIKASIPGINKVLGLRIRQTYTLSSSFTLNARLRIIL